MRIEIVIFDLLLFYLLCGHMVIRKFYPRKLQVKALLKDYEKHLRHLLRRDRDVLSQEHRGRIETAVAEIRQVRATAAFEEAEACLDSFRDPSRLDLPVRSAAWVKEYLEVFVVALALAFGVRGLFLQPFKIPTGSMQPTLFGIHFRQSEAPIRKNPVKRLVEYLHYSRRYVDVTVKRAGYLEDAKAAFLHVPFVPATIVTIGGVKYRLPGDPKTVGRHLCPEIGGHVHAWEEAAKRRRRGFRMPTPPPVFYNEGHVLARGCLELGDHLFVDRTYLNFTEPRRGDITVFLTDGIRDRRGQTLGGRYYIKRLVALPGDEIAIRDRKLYVKAPGASDFRLADNSDAPGFERIYSLRGGYRGYCHDPRSQFLYADQETFRLKRDQYFMLGDNSENSKDSRFWGSVPRENLVGRALFVWWPFSRRWGVTDRVEPLDFPSPPTPGTR